MKNKKGFIGAGLSLIGLLIVVAIIGYLFTAQKGKQKSSENTSVGSVEVSPLLPIEAVREAEDVSEAHNCRVSGGTYVGCPENLFPNQGLCIPCECPEESEWSFETRRCVETAL